MKKAAVEACGDKTGDYHRKQKNTGGDCMAGFHEIIGHDDVVNHLQNAIQMGKVSHAYIFNGEVGAGKKMLASAFALWQKRRSKRFWAQGLPRFAATSSSYFQSTFYSIYRSRFYF